MLQGLMRIAAALLTIAIMGLIVACQPKDRKFYRVIETWRKKKERWILWSGLNGRPLHGPEVFAA